MRTEDVSHATRRADCTPQVSNWTLAQLYACLLAGATCWTDGRKENSIFGPLQSAFRN